MFELRVLNGLHQGAALPLFGEQWCIGASAEADLALFDAGIAERHVCLHRIEQRWRLQAEQGLLKDDKGQLLAQIAELPLDLPFSIGDVRLCVSSSDQPWPAEPAAVPKPLESPEIARNTTSAFLLSRLPESAQKSLLGALLIVAMLVTAVGMLDTDEHQAQASLMSAPPLKTDLATVSEVRKQMMKMLSERELTQRVSLQVINGQIALDGNLSLEEMALLSRMLVRFSEQFDTAVPVMSRVREYNGQPPFKILQIVGGPNGHVVLEDGQRLFLGDEVDGVRLVTIDNTKVVFDGMQRYEVRW